MAQRGQTIPGIANGAVVNRTMAKSSSASTINNKQFTTCSGVGTDQPIGVFEYDVITGLSCAVVVDGVCKIRAGAAIALSATGRTPITNDALGRAILAAPGAGVNIGIVGYALEPAAALGDEIDVLVAPTILQG